MEPVDLLRQARSLGLDGVCITEHSASWDESSLSILAREGPPLVFAGVEVGTELGDVLVFLPNGLAPETGLAAELRALADDAGGALVAAHPFRRFFAPGILPNVEEALANPLFELVDAVEVFNGMGSRPELEFAARVMRRLPLPAVGGSDTHAPHTVGRCYTVFDRWLETMDDLIREVRSGRVKAVHPLFGLEFNRGA